MYVRARVDPKFPKRKLEISFFITLIKKQSMSLKFCYKCKLSKYAINLVNQSQLLFLTVSCTCL